MQELLVDFITSMDGYASAEGWPGWWGLEGPARTHPVKRGLTLMLGDGLAQPPVVLS